MISLTQVGSSTYTFPYVWDDDGDPYTVRLSNPAALPTCITYSESTKTFTFTPPFPATSTSYSVNYYLMDNYNTSSIVYTQTFTFDIASKIPQSIVSALPDLTLHVSAGPGASVPLTFSSPLIAADGDTINAYTFVDWDYTNPSA